MGTRNFTHIKKYGPFRGLNKGVSDLALQDDFFSLAKNAFVAPGSTALTSRPGYKPTALDPSSTDQKVFAGLYVETDPDTGAQYEKELVLNLTANSAELISPLEINLSNVGVVDAYFEVEFDSATSLWKAVLTNAATGAVLSSTNLDSAAGTPSVTTTSLVSTLNGLADFNATLSPSDAGSEYASMALPAQKILVPSGGTRTIYGFYPKSITVTNNLLTTYAASYENSSAAPISHTNLNNVLYFALPGIGLCKCDGQVITRSGAPVFGTSIARITNGSFALSGGSISTGNYFYAHQFEIRDSKGNIAVGIGETTREDPSGTGFLASTTVQTPGKINVTGASSNASITFTVPTTRGSGLGPIEARGATIDGNQTFSLSDPTIDVSVGHTLKPGDTACFAAVINGYEVLLSGPIESVTSTSITLGEEGWTVLNRRVFTMPCVKTQDYLLFPLQEEVDVTLTELTNYPGTLNITSGDHISNNIRIRLYRNKGDGVTGNSLTDFNDLYLLDIIANKHSASGIVYSDGKPDSRLLVPFSPVIDLGPVPYRNFDGMGPACSIVHNHQNRLYLAGNVESPNTLYRSDLLNGSEFFNPNGDADLNLETKVASKITAIGSTSDNLVVGKTRGIKLIAGDLSSDTNIRIDDLSFELGLANQASTVSAVDKCIGLTQLGPIEITSNGEWNFLGSQDLGQKSRLEGILKVGSYDLEFASATVNPEKGLYYLYLPPKGSLGVTEEENESFLQFDQTGDLRDNTTFGSAYVYSITQDAWFEWTGFNGTGGAYVKDGRLHTVRTGSVGTLLLQESMGGQLSDFVDWFSGISFDVATNWITLGEPFLYKQFLRALIQNVELDSLATRDFTLTIRAEKDWNETVQSSVTISDLEKVGYGQLKIKGNKSRSMRIRLQHSEAKKRPIISGLTIELAAPFRPKVKQE